MLKFALLLALALSALLAACSATPTTDRPPSYRLTVNILPSGFGGTVTLNPPPGQDGSYPYGTVVRLTTSPPVHHECKDTPYWAFVGWSGEAQGSASTAEITMDSDKSVTAGFGEVFPPQCPPTDLCENPNLEIEVKGDVLQFDKDKFEVAAGTDVVLCFSNESRLVQHNWVMVLDGTGNQVAQRGIAAGPDNDYVQAGDPDVIANTRLVNPGEAAEVRFTAPQAGAYQFVCTFPGHNFLMFGEFAVPVATPTPASYPSPSATPIIEEEGILRIKRTQEYKALVDKYGSDQVSVKAVNLHEEDEAGFLRIISDGFLMEPGCIILLKAGIDDGYVYQLNEEFDIVYRMTLSQFQERARKVDLHTMEKFYSSLQ